MPAPPLPGRMIWTTEIRWLSPPANIFSAFQADREWKHFQLPTDFCGGLFQRDRR
jgi:hypothetical protein